MNIDEARAYLINMFHAEYQVYIKTQLAGDFAVTLAKKFEQKNNKQMQTEAKCTNSAFCQSPENCRSYGMPYCPLPR